MAIQRWDPLREVMQLHERVNRLFEEALSRSSGPTAPEDLTAGGWRPPVDVFEQGDRYVVRVDLPGVDPEDVEIQVEEGVLVLRGERRRDQEISSDSFLRAERPFGKFSLQLALPPSVDRSGISASHRGGVLSATLPKRRQERPSRIQVEVE